MATKVGAYIVADKDNPTSDEQALLTALRIQFHVDLVDDDDVADAKMDFTAYSAIVVGRSCDVTKLSALTNLGSPIVFTKGEHAATIGKMATVGAGNYGTSTGTQCNITNNSHPTVLTETLGVHDIYTESGNLGWLLSTALAGGVGVFANIEGEPTHIGLAILPIDGINSDGLASPEIRYFIGIQEPGKYTDHTWDHVEWIANWLVHQIALVTIVYSLTKSKIIEEMLGKGKFKKATTLYDYLVTGTTGAPPFEVITEQEIRSVMERLEWIKNALRRGTGTILPVNKSLYDVIALDRLDHPTYGLSAIETFVDEVETLLKSGTYGLSALKTLIDAVEGKLDVPDNFKADVSALALEATLSTHDTDIKTLLATLNDLSDAEVWAYATRTLTSHVFPFTNPAAVVDLTNVKVTSKSIEDPVIVSDITKVANVTKYLTPTALGAGGTATLWTPAAGTSVRFKRVQVSVDAGTRIDLRWGTTAFESYYLPANGTIIFNAIGVNEEGGVDVSLTLLSSAAANVTASAKGDEV